MSNCKYKTPSPLPFSISLLFNFSFLSAILVLQTINTKTISATAFIFLFFFFQPQLFFFLKNCFVFGIFRCFFFFCNFTVIHSDGCFHQMFTIQRSHIETVRLIRNETMIRLVDFPLKCSVLNFISSSRYFFCSSPNFCMSIRLNRSNGFCISAFVRLFRWFSVCRSFHDYLFCALSTIVESSFLRTPTETKE